MAVDPFNPYADLYVNPQGVGDQRPTSLRVVQDQELVNAYTGKVAIVTGGTAVAHPRAAVYLCPNASESILSIRAHQVQLA